MEIDLYSNIRFVHGVEEAQQGMFIKNEPLYRGNIQQGIICNTYNKRVRYYTHAIGPRSALSVSFRNLESISGVARRIDLHRIDVKLRRKWFSETSGKYLKAE